MNYSILSFLVAAIILRLLVGFLLFPSNITSAGGDVLSQALGPGILHAVRAAILDPIHTWDHLEEACFWLENSKFSVDNDTNIDTGYGAIYKIGTRIVAPPLVVAVLGQSLVCRPNSVLLWIIKLLLLTIADGVGAYCIYVLGYRIYQTEQLSNEAEMEYHTILSENRNIGDETVNENMVIPEILRPEMGWTVSLPSKRLPSDKCSTHLSTIEEKPCNDKNQLEKGKTCNDNHQLEGNHINNGGSTFKYTTAPPEKEPLLLLDQLPIIASLCYFGNPISMLANAIGSLRSLWDSFLLLSFYYATMPVAETSKGGISKHIPSATKVSFFLALVTYVDAGYAVFAIPILLWRGLLNTPTSISKAQHYDWKRILAFCILHLSGIHYLASLLVGGGQSSYKNVLVQTILPNVAFIQQDCSGSVPGPSMGLHW
jgi:hypothetical protein